MRKAVLGAFVLGLLLKFFIFDLMIAEGNSMYPSIRPGSILVISRLVYGFRLPWMKNYIVRWNAPKEGEIVVFYTPSGGLAVKRCVEITGRYFMALGDNGPQSFDSRSYGAVPADHIIGRVLGVK
ncbi:MAG: S26 family signal peptidase [Treponema sp.]|nr:S26 family signal peptidase [Treponema sp.]